MATITYDFTNPDLYVDWVHEYTKALYDPSIRYIFLKGSAGAGKSVVVGQLTLQEVLAGKEYAWIRKIRATIKNSCYQSIYNQAKKWDLLNDIEFQKTLYAETKNNDGKILFLGLDNPEKIKSLADLDVIVVEEATDLTYEDITQLNIRLRGRTNQKLVFLFNPISDQHWLKTEIKDNPEWDWTKTAWIEKTVLDNKFAGKQYVESLKRMKLTNPEMYKVYFLNEWGQSQKGLIFTKFSVSDIEFVPQFAGLDFGFNDPTVLVYGRLDDVYEGRKILRLREIVYESGLTEASLIERFNQLGVPRNLKITADESRPELIQALQNAGYFVAKTKKGPGSVYRGILKMQEYDIEIVNSPNGTKEFQNYCWIEKGGTILDQEPKGGFDHFIDASRYSLQALDQVEYTPYETPTTQRRFTSI